MFRQFFQISTSTKKCVNINNIQGLHTTASPQLSQYLLSACISSKSSMSSATLHRFVKKKGFNLRGVIIGTSGDGESLHFSASFTTSQDKAQELSDALNSIDSIGNVDMKLCKGIKDCTFERTVYIAKSKSPAVAQVASIFKVYENPIDAHKDPCNEIVQIAA